LLQNLFYFIAAVHTCAVNAAIYFIAAFIYLVAHETGALLLSVVYTMSQKTRHCTFFYNLTLADENNAKIDTVSAARLVAATNY